MSASNYTVITLTHAKFDREVKFLLGNIGPWHHSDVYSATVIYTPSGVVAVKQTVNEVETIINAAIQPTTKEQN